MRTESCKNSLYVYLIAAAVGWVLLIGPMILFFWWPEFFSQNWQVRADLHLYLIGIRSSLTSARLFTGRELFHLVDVRQLVIAGEIISAICLLVLSLFRKHYQYKLGLRLGSLFALIISSLVLLVSLLKTDEIILAFHRLLFTNAYWQLDFNQSYLLRLYPPQFWVGILVVTLGTSFVVSWFFYSRRSV